MAQLKNTLISGSARVTGTLFANYLGAVKLPVTSSYASDTDNHMITFTSSDGNTEYTYIGSGTAGSLAIATKTAIALWPGSTTTSAANAFQNTRGIRFFLDRCEPIETTNGYSLGSSTMKFTNVYATNLYGSLATSNLTGQVSTTNGGTGLSTIGTAGQVLKVNSSATGLEWGAAADVINGVTISHLNQDNSPHYWGGSLLFDSPNNATYQGRIEAYTKTGTDSDSGDYLRFLAIKISDSSYNAGVQISLTNGILFGAAWNDYAEYRHAREPIAPGRVIVDTDEGAVILASERLQPGAQVVSDTYGFIEGKTENAKTPIAVAGRVLVYPYRSRTEYHAGMCVCSAPDGTVDIMTRDEIKEYPDCIVGIVSEIPTYETWGETNVKVDGRIWVKVK